MSAQRPQPYRARARLGDRAGEFALSIQGGIVDGRIIDAEPDGVSTMDVPHNLGRAYRGAFCVGQVAGITVRVMHPDDHDDARASVSLVFSSPYTGKLRLWVF